MSMMDSGMAFANPFSPLHQSLIRTMPNTAMMGQQPAPTIPQSDQRNTLLRAHNLRTGNVGAGQMNPGDRSAGPMGQSIAKYKTLMMAAAGLSDDDQKKFEPALDDPNISPQALQGLLQMHAKVKGAPQQHSFGGDGGAGQQQAGGASIGGPTPANVPPGSMQIMQGSGRDGRAVMSQDAMHQWMQRAAQTMPQGESGQRISGTYTPTLSKAGMDEWNRQMPGQPLPVRSTPVADHGFQINGIQPPAQQQSQAAGDPVVAMHAVLVQAGAPPEGLAQWRAFAQAGATPEQLNQAAWHILDERFRQQSQDRSDLRMQQGDQHRQQSEQQTQQYRQQQQAQHDRDMQIRQIQHQQTLASQMGDQDTVTKLQGQIDGMMKPQQPNPAPGRQPAPGANPPQATATGPNGQKLHLINGQWVPA